MWPCNSHTSRVSGHRPEGDPKGRNVQSCANGKTGACALFGCHCVLCGPPVGYEWALLGQGRHGDVPPHAQVVRGYSGGSRGTCEGPCVGRHHSGRSNLQEKVGRCILDVKFILGSDFEVPSTSRDRTDRVLSRGARATLNHVTAP